MSLIGQLNTLESSGLIRLLAAQPELEYIFRHALVQDAAYESLLKQDRRQIHLAVGETLERLHPESADELAATLAYHFERAQALERAIHHLRLAAERARDSYANAEAIAIYQRAIRLVEQPTHEDGDQLEIWRQAAVELREEASDLLEATGQHDAAIDGYGEALSLALTDDRTTRARLRRKTGYA